MTPALKPEPCYSERFVVDPKDQHLELPVFPNCKPKDTKVSPGEWLALLWKLGSFPKTNVCDTGDSHMPGSDQVLDPNLLPRG